MRFPVIRTSHHSTKQNTSSVFHHQEIMGTTQGGDDSLVMDKTLKTKESARWQLNTPRAQIVVIAMVCFCCPGMFNALSGMGGGGQEDDTAANDANTALYTTFAVFGILGGGIYNLLGPRLTVMVGACTYVVYAGSFLYYNHKKDETFAIIAGALLGAGAGLLWAGQGAIMTSYPVENSKGRYISLFWTIFNMGGVIGGLVPFILNYDRHSATSVSDWTYIAFMIFMSFGILLGLGLLAPSVIVRSDGTRPSAVKLSGPCTEIKEMGKLFKDWRMLLLVVPSWASNFFYTYQFNNVNGKLFTVRTRGLNNVFYWGAQMVGSVAIGYVLDTVNSSRKRRGLIGVGVVFVLQMCVWGGGFANQLRYSRTKAFPGGEIDFKDSGSMYAGPFVLYFCYGLLDAMFQTCVYWTIGALAEDSMTLSRFSGFYKGVQSAGAAVAWQTDKHGTSLMTELVVNWGLTTAACPLLAVLIVLAVCDSSTSSSSSVVVEHHGHDNVV